MFDENQLVGITWANKTKKYFESKGYEFTNYGDIFYVKVRDLPSSSHKNIEVICDFCGETYYPTFDCYNKRKNKVVDSCDKCKVQKQWMATKDKRAKEKFNKLQEFCNKKDYILLTQESEYSGVHMEVRYICKRHGLQTGLLDNLIRGHGCIACSYEERGINLRHPIEYVISVIESCNSNKLLNPNDYENSNVRNLKIKCGLCGRIYITSFADYVRNNQTRCKSCSQSESVGEMIIRNFLENNSIEFVQEKRFEDCVDKSFLPFDFYLPNRNLIIEFDGQHHFYDTGFGNHELTKKHDSIKNNYCNSHGINLLRIPYWEGSNIEQILTKQLNL